MNQLSFEIKQHTPLIHFQGWQQGTFLRGSQVAPLLDKFLWSKIKDRPDQEQILVGSRYNSELNHYALDYELDIRYDEDAVKVLSAPSDSKKHKRELPGFFGNQGQDLPPEKHKTYLYHQGLFKIIFSSFNDSLLEQIDRHFDEFMFTHNFGNRTSKGFGSFYRNVDKINYKEVFEQLDFVARIKIDDIKNKGDLWQYHYDVSEKIYNIYKDLRFNRVKVKNKWLKKSSLLDYFDNPSDTVLDVLNGMSDPNTMSIPKILNAKFYRALLGLPEVMEYREQGYSVNVSHSSLLRFPSPLFFKVVNKRIFLIVKDSSIVNELLNSSVTLRIVSSDNGPKINYGNNDKTTIASLPDRFNILDFLCSKYRDREYFGGMNIIKPSQP